MNDSSSLIQVKRDSPKSHPKRKGIMIHTPSSLLSCNKEWSFVGNQATCLNAQLKESTIYILMYGVIKTPRDLFCYDGIVACTISERSLGVLWEFFLPVYYLLLYFRLIYFEVKKFILSAVYFFFIKESSFFIS